MSSRRQLVTTVVTVAMTLTSATTAFAQGREPLKQPASIPLDLATALIASGGFGWGTDAQILVGSLPEWVTARVYVPAGARVLGSAFIGSTVVGVISVPTSSDTLLKQFENALQQRGWKSPPTVPSRGGGFRPSPSALGSAGQRLTLCRDHQVLTGWVSRSRAATSTLMMRLSESGDVGVCNPPPYRAETRSPIWPTLFDPEGASDMRMSTTCRRSSSGSMSTGTMLKTIMSADAILGHYGRQLQDSGWAPAIMSPAIVGRTWTRPDSTGATEQLSLTVSSSPQDSTCRVINLEIKTTRQP
jgi:hypothetical protein